MTGTSRYSGAAVIAPSQWAALPCPYSSPTSSSRKDRNDRHAGDSAAHGRPHMVGHMAYGRHCRPHGRTPPPEPLRRYGRGTTARFGRGRMCAIFANAFRNGEMARSGRSAGAGVSSPPDVSALCPRCGRFVASRQEDRRRVPEPGTPSCRTDCVDPHRGRGGADASSGLVG